MGVKLNELPKIGNISDGDGFSLLVRKRRGDINRKISFEDLIKSIVDTVSRYDHISIEPDLDSMRIKFKINQQDK